MYKMCIYLKLNKKFKLKGILRKILEYQNKRIITKTIIILFKYVKKN